jgi:hypothetical protein
VPDATCHSVDRASANATSSGNGPAEVHAPNRPTSALFEGNQGLQKTETTYDPRTQTVTMKLLVQDPNGYFIPSLRRDNFAVLENGVRQQNATVEVERAPISMSVLMEYGGRYQSMNADAAGRFPCLPVSSWMRSVATIAFRSCVTEIDSRRFRTSRAPWICRGV